ncbi:MAG: hypothetical protein H6570_02320 [Lewinellaceae bacterium]|nr:hypothetical protein [Lewinellaceae bacterium]
MRRRTTPGGSPELRYPDAWLKSPDSRSRLFKKLVKVRARERIILFDASVLDNPAF